ncbi:MAG: flagellar hook-length control protein FliK, partial [Octadecabacter sp.]
TATNRTQTVATATANNAYAQQVAQQITAAIVQTSGGTTEIMLNPEELGRVRIAMTAGDAGMTVTLLAERPETTDLMRRHIEHLTRELRDMGYDNPTFNFEDQEDSSGDHQGKNAPPVDAPIDLLTTDPNTLTRRHVTLSGGLDLKL